MSRGQESHFQDEDVTPTARGWYYVEVLQVEKESPDDPNYFRDWYEFNGIEWDLDSHLTRKLQVVRIISKEQ